MFVFLCVRVREIQVCFPFFQLRKGRASLNQPLQLGMVRIAAAIGEGLGGISMKKPSRQA